MDSIICAAARALAAGDPLGALNRVALREDAAALALRGIAMAQLGELDRARSLLRRAARGFGPKESVARARCVVAEAEIALVSRDLRWTESAAREALARAGRAAREAGMPALVAEVERASLILDTPAARLVARGRERPLLLEDVEALLASDALVVDACRHAVRHAGTEISLATR